jgi:hypothetical protein
MTYKTQIWYYALSSLSVLLPIAVGFGRWNKLPNTLRLIPIYSVVVGIIDIVGWRYPRLYMNSNHITVNFITSIEALALGYIYYRILQNNISKKVFLGVLTMFFLFFLQQLFINNLAVLNGRLLASASLIMMLASLVSFYDMLNLDTDRRLGQLYCFWLNSGVLLSFSGSFFAYMYSDQLNQVFNLLHLLWYIPLTLIIVLKLSLAVAMWVFDPKKDWI